MVEIISNSGMVELITKCLRCHWTQLPEEADRPLQDFWGPSYQRSINPISLCLLVVVGGFVIDVKVSVFLGIVSC